MKTKFLIAICAAALFAVSCNGGEPITPEEPEKVKEPVIEGPVRIEFDWNSEYEGILMQQYDALYDANLPVNKIEAEIIGGIGDYKIIYPQEIFCVYWGDESGGIVPYSEDILKVWVEGDVIHVERVLPSYNPNGNGQPLWLKASFIVEDGKGLQKTFGVGTLIVWGGTE